MNNLKYYIELFSEKGAKILGILLLAWLTYWQAVSTFRLPFNYNKEYITEFPDSPIKNLLFGIFFVIFLFIVQKMLLRGEPEQQKKRVFLLAIIDIILVGILLTIWVSICHIEPYWDQLQVFQTAQKFRMGDYSDMQNLLYFQMYTQQYGLIWFEELFLGIWNDYRIFQYLNVIFIMMIIFFFYQITDLLFSDQRINLYCLIGITAFIPMHLYVVYVYGDLGSIALCLVAIWGLLKWNTTRQLRYLPVILLCASIATLIRNNSLIILIAILIVSVLYACKIWNWQPLVIGIMTLAIPLLSIQLVESHYESRSGMEIGEGLPAVVWFSMGLHQDSSGVGLDSGYDESIWWQCNSDPEATSERALNDLNVKLEELRANPHHAKELFRFKALEQWIEPTFSSLTLTGKFDQPANSLVDTIYFGMIPDLICRLMNYFLFMLYSGALIHTIKGLFRKEGIHSCLMLIIFIGGFLFGLIWEAKGRYMMPYAMCLIPYMACGISHVQEISGKIVKRFIEKKSE